MQTSYLTINSAFVMPAVLLGQALAHHCDLNVESVSYIHHDIQPLGEIQNWKFMPHQRKGAAFINKGDYAANAKGPSLSMQPTASGHLRASLIIDIGDSLADFDEIEYFFRQGRFAGGEIISHGEIQSAETLKEIRFRSGFCLIDKSDMLGDKASIDAFVKAMAEPFDENKDNGWLTPFVAGYALISEPNHKPGARDACLHAFCEPMISLAQYKSVNSELIKEKGLSFWALENHQSHFSLTNTFKQP
ncbi:type I-F CRISPR-associated protein Csy2 [Hydrogenovibrio halophilus]|uniref:type I-F CRISPR-associated protein Csy2 n=1 Tax=Hydrogenovibrio halophilus TaxID=373391 RepID=UPI0003617482